VKLASGSACDGGRASTASDLIAKVAQTSLLGSQHIELAEPTGEPGIGKLKNGSNIPLDRTGRYITTEEPGDGHGPGW
jgi:phospholipid/cholesterol/gamma-HCH transport system substrate-binding protein